jgi:hypothetical protein
MKIMNFVRAAAVAALLLPAISFASTIANTGAVYLETEPGSWVGGGIGAPSATWTHGSDGIFFGATNYDKGVSITYSGDDYWSFDFAAPSYNPATNTNNGQQLQVGFYDNATRFPFNSPTRAGLDISGAGRGNNTLGGWFNVLEVVYGTSGELLSFAVDFRQYDESPNMTGPSLYGSLRFNSSIGLHTLDNGIPGTVTPVPEPETYAMMLAGLGLIGFVARRRKQA